MKGQAMTEVMVEVNIPERLIYDVKANSEVWFRDDVQFPEPPFELAAGTFRATVMYIIRFIDPDGGGRGKPKNAIYQRLSLIIERS